MRSHLTSFLIILIFCGRPPLQDRRDEHLQDRKARSRQGPSRRYRCKSRFLFFLHVSVLFVVLGFLEGLKGFEYLLWSEPMCMKRICILVILLRVSAFTYAFAFTTYHLSLVSPFRVCMRNRKLRLRVHTSTHFPTACCLPHTAIFVTNHFYRPSHHITFPTLPTITTLFSHLKTFPFLPPHLLQMSP